MLTTFLLLILLSVPAWAQKQGWEKEWKETLAAARREGKVVVAGGADREVRLNIPAKFRARFGIPVEYIGGRSSGVSARLRTERRVGVYTIDVFLGGVGTMSRVLYPEKMLDPLKPVFLLPKVVDPSKWKKGKLWFVDPEEKYVLRLLSYVSPLFSINTRYAKPEEFKSIKDLLDPKWKGKIAGVDPTIPGRGSGFAATLYLQFGEEFVKKLYIDQKPFLTDQTRSLTDGLARGTYFIAFNLGSDDVLSLQEEGFPLVNIYSLPDARGTISAGSGTMALLNKAPHPNAARLFVNWMASKEGLEVYARARGTPTTRNDIDELSFVFLEEIPHSDLRYFDNADWNYHVTKRSKIRQYIRTLLRR